MVIRVAISGKIGSGKTTLANLFVQRGFKLMSIADVMKQIVMYLWDLSFDEVFGKNKRRDLIIWLGKIFREYDKNVWINFLIRNLPKNENVVVDDVRMPIEFKKLKEAGFLMIRLNCPTEVRKKRSPSYFEEAKDDETEVSLDKINKEEWDYIVDTTASIEKLNQFVDKLVAENEG